MPPLPPEAALPPRREVPIFGVRATPMSEPAVVDLVLSRPTPALRIANFNLHGVQLYHRDGAFRRFTDAADIVLADGYPIWWALNRADPTLDPSHRVGSSDWLFSLLKRDPELHIVAVGTSPESAVGAAQEALRMAPSVRWTAFDGFALEQVFGEPTTMEAALTDADVVLVGMGMGRQEAWIEEHQHLMTHGVIANVGGCLDYLSGHQVHTPREIGRSGWEWLYRFGKDPRRNASRVLLDPARLGVRLGANAVRSKLFAPGGGHGHPSGEFTDSGTDAGLDAGAVAGLDTGRDAGLDAGAVTGPDAGLDAGLDAGRGGILATNTLPVTAVVVSHNRRELLGQCLDALRGQDVPPRRVVVVDNASSDGSADFVAERFPDVELIRASTNTGGAGGFALGMEHALADPGCGAVWLMDDDTVPNPGALAELIRAHTAYRELPTSPGAPALLASRVEWTDGREHPMNTARTKVGVSVLEQADADAVGGRPIRTASFVSVLIDARHARIVGLPAADFFIWNDDFEYCARLTRHGRGLHIPASVVTHKTKVFGGTDADPGPRVYYEVRNKRGTYTRSPGLTPAERVLYGGASIRHWARTWRRSSDRATLRDGLTRGIRDALHAPRPTGEVLAESGAPRPSGQGPLTSP